MGKWCFKLKKHRFEHILKYKARWIAHGYLPEGGLDYVETFVAVVKLMSYKCLFAMGVKRGYRIRHMNVVTAFLYCFLDEVIYMEQSHLFATELDKVCKLIKALYGLKQVPHIWYKTFVELVKKLRFTRLELNYRIVVSVNKQLFIAVYIDNLLIFGMDLPHLEDI